MEIAKLFSTLGFRVNERELKRAEKAIDNLSRKMQSMSGTLSSSTAPARKHAASINAVASRYDKVGSSLQRVRSDFESVQNQFRAGNITAERRNHLLQRMVIEYNRLKSAKASAAATPDGTSRGSNHGLISALHSDAVLGAGAAAFGAYASTRAYQDYVAMQQGLTSATGSTEQAKSDMQYLVKLSRQLGLYVNDLGRSFSNFSAAAAGSNLSSQQVRQTFEGVASQARVLNLSAADTQGVFRA